MLLTKIHLEQRKLFLIEFFFRREKNYTKEIETKPRINFNMTSLTNKNTTPV